METIKSWYHAVVDYVAFHPEQAVAIYVATVAVLVLIF
jgi:hypothetical protein